MPDGIIRMDQGWKLDAGHRFDQPPLVPPPPVPVPGPGQPIKKKGKHMDWMPRKRANRYLWWKNLRDNIDVEGPKMGLSPAEITAVKDLAIAQLAKMDATDAASVALDGARAEEEDASSANEFEIRTQVKNWKTRPGFAASGCEGVLQLVGPGSNFDRNTFKPSVKVSFMGGQIKLDFIKSECDSVAVYCRLRGSTTWNRLGTDSSSPYFDTNPLANPAVAEVREYFVRGIIDDVEIGVESDIVHITLS
jgi:hypothetical protein